ncbi:O-acetylserine/cysteine exporter [Thiomonas sp. FB-6]|uniref:O-acetylserine/cysteine exporter n=1 Tax=Thiomonas sp. FB-6 TaxID=1158291 RepID=UPI000376CEC0|nr:O-acetylserine/cysteine exporter [Thiomonas sp. FB-6]
MRIRDLLLALLTVVIWGSNFVVMKLGLRGLPPLLFCALRFAFTAFPVVLLVRRPALPWWRVAAWGIAQFAVLFGLLMTGLKLGMAAGLASIVMQLQAFFTIALAWALLREKARPVQLLGGAIALAGMGVVAWNLQQRTSLVGLLLLIVAAASWAVANVMARRLGPVNAVALASWASLYAVPPLLLLSVLLEGAGTDLRALRDMDAMSWLVVGFQAYPATLFGFGLWAMLMRRYPAAQIAPFTLLVPVSGMLTAALVLHEPLQAWKLAAAAMVVGGLALNQIPSLRHRLLAQRA